MRHCAGAELTVIGFLFGFYRNNNLRAELLKMRIDTQYFGIIDIYNIHSN